MCRIITLVLQKKWNVKIELSNLVKVTQLVYGEVQTWKQAIAVVPLCIHVLARVPRPLPLPSTILWEGTPEVPMGFSCG